MQASPLYATCSLPDCSKKHHAKGYCANHYAKFIKYGDATKIVCETPYGEPYQWILRHMGYDQAACLRWPFATFSDGRGSIVVKGKKWQAHRLMCTLVNGEPASQHLEAAHNCGKGHEGCVAPNHLRWAAKLDNNDDKYQHNSFPNAITKEIDLQIYACKGWLNLEQAATKFNVSISTVSKIYRKTHWVFQRLNGAENG